MPHSIRILVLADSLEELDGAIDYYPSFIPGLVDIETEGGTYHLSQSVRGFSTGWFGRAMRYTNPSFPSGPIWIIKRHPGVESDQIGAFLRDFQLGVHLGLPIPQEALGETYSCPEGFCFQVTWPGTDFDEFFKEAEEESDNAA